MKSSPDSDISGQYCFESAIIFTLRRLGHQDSSSYLLQSTTPSPSLQNYHRPIRLTAQVWNISRDSCLIRICIPGLRKKIGSSASKHSDTLRRILLDTRKVSATNAQTKSVSTQILLVEETAAGDIGDMGGEVASTDFTPWRSRFLKFSKARYQASLLLAF